MAALRRRSLAVLLILLCVGVLATPRTDRARAEGETITLAQSSSSSTLGETVTFTVSIDWSYAFVNGTVTFTFDGEDADVVNNLRGDEGGGAAASWDYTRTDGDVGPHTIGARFDDGDGLTASADPVQHTWTVRTTITLAGSADPTDVGEAATFTATVGPEGPDMPESLSMTVSYIHGVQIFAKDVPVDGGEAVLSYRSDAAETLTVRACPTNEGPVRCDSIDHTWAEPPPRLTVTPGSQQVLPGDSCVVTATFSRGTPVAGAEIDANVTNPATGTSSADLPPVHTDSRGRATIRWERPDRGTDTLQVYEASTETGATATCSARQPPLPTVAVRPRSQQVNAADRCVVTATLTAGEPRSGVVLSYRVTNPARAGRPGGTARTDANGRVRIDWSAPDEGTDAMTVTAPGGRTATATCRVGPAPRLAVTPSRGDTLIKTDATLQATLTSGGAAVVGHQVRFTATNDADGVPPATGTAVTDAAGRAFFRWTRTVSSHDTIAVVAVADDAQASSRWRWRSDPLPGPVVLGVTPYAATVRAGETTTVRARVTMAGEPRSGATVTLRAVLPDQPDVLVRGVTAANGTTTLSWRRAVAGTDTVALTTTVDGRTASARAIRSWTGTPEEPTIVLSPSGASTQVGTRFQPVAAVTAGGRPAAGVSVTMVAARRDDPTQPVQRTVITGTDGLARFPFTRTIMGLEDISVRATVAERQVAASVVHRWTEDDRSLPEDPPSDPGTRDPRPGGDFVITGSGCAAGSEVVLILRHGDVSIPLGSTFADESGRFRLVTALTTVPLDHYRVTSSCGAVSHPVVDVVGPEVNGSAAPGATTAGVVVFFVLLGAAVVRTRSWFS